MVEVKREVFLELIEEGYFDEPQDIAGILKRLNQHGYTVSGRKVGRIAQTLTFLCRDRKLIREEVPREEKKNRGSWIYKKYSRHVV